MGTWTFKSPDLPVRGTCALSRGVNNTETVRVQGLAARLVFFQDRGSGRESRRPRLPSLNSPKLRAVRITNLLSQFGHTSGLNLSVPQCRDSARKSRGSVQPERRFLESRDRVSI